MNDGVLIIVGDEIYNLLSKGKSTASKEDNKL